MAQIIRFDTNVGTFDMELNPTGNPNLQGHVDNMLDYVESGSYDRTVINRASEGFVLQMGGFQLGDMLTLPENFNDFPSVTRNDPVIVDADGDGEIDFDTSNLNNNRGTVTLALAAGNANSGTSSFFVNIIDNVEGSPINNLDASGFVPFADILDMSTIDLIMGLPQTDFAQGSLAGDDVPTLVGNRAVFVERAFVLESLADQAAALRDQQLVDMTDGLDGEGDQALATLGDISAEGGLALNSVVVPEPPALVLAVGALMMIYIMKPSK